MPSRSSTLNRRPAGITTAALAATAALATTAPHAHAAVACTYDPGSVFEKPSLTVSIGQHGDSASLEVDAGVIRVSESGNPSTCSGGVSTVTNTDEIVVVDKADNPATPEPSDATSTVSIEGAPTFSPGKTQEQASDAFSEIEFQVDLKDGDDRLFLTGTPKADSIQLGTNGIDWNAASGDPAPDADVTFLSPVEGWVAVIGAASNDGLSGQGGPGAGAPFIASGLLLSGQEGEDDLAGGNAISADAEITETRLAGGDVLFGGLGNDTLGGFDGDDRLYGDEGGNTMRGGFGKDTVSYSSRQDAGVTVDLSQSGPQAVGGGATDSIVDVENAQGSSFNDVLIGDDAANALDGQDGNDTLAGRGGNDRLDGGEDFGPADSDTATYANSLAGVTADLTAGEASGEGNDTLKSIENLTGSLADDLLIGDAKPNRIVGLAGSDTISAREGADTVEIRDGQNDNANCGSEIDAVTADRASMDAVDANCEIASFLPEADADADVDVDVDVDGDGVGDASDACRVLAGPPVSGCPVARRTVKLAHVPGKDLFRGSVSAPDAVECIGEQRVVVRRRRRGRDRAVAKPVQTTDRGRFKLEKEVGPGRYYAQVSPMTIADVASCAAARSKAVEVG